MIRVAFVVPTLEIGGTETQVVEFCERLDKSKFLPEIVLTDKTGPLEVRAKDAGIPVFLVRKEGKVCPGYIFQLRDFFQERQYDIVSTYIFAGNFYGRLAALFMNPRPVIISSERSVTVWKGWFKRWIDRVLARKTDIILANSESVKRYNVNKVGIPPEKIRVLYNGKDPARFSRPPEKRLRKLMSDLGIGEKEIVLSHISNMRRGKRPDIFLRASASLTRRYDNLKLLVVGDGEERKSLETLAETLGIRDRVNFTGLRPDVTDIMYISRAVCLMTEWEGMSNVLVETLGCGRVIVASDIEPNREIIRHSKNGLLSKLDPESLADVLALVIEEDKTIAGIRVEARKTFERYFDMARVIEEFEEVCRELIERKGRRIR